MWLPGGRIRRRSAAARARSSSLASSSSSEAYSDDCEAAFAQRLAEANAALEAGYCPEVERSMARIAALHGTGEPLPALKERAELERCEVGG